MGMVCLCLAVSAYAAPPQADPADVEALLKDLEGTTAAEAPLVLKTGEGYVRFLSAPPSAHFRTEASAAKAAFSAEQVARAFMTKHGGAFGVASARAAYATERLRQRGAYSFVRLQQTYGGLPVFAAGASVQLNQEGGVLCVLSDVMRDTITLDASVVALTPTVTAEAAKQAAKAWTLAEHGEEYPISLDSLACSRPELLVFDPSVLGAPGAVCLAWQMTVSSDAAALLRLAVFVDAHAGTVVFSYPLVHDAKYRAVYDANNRVDYSWYFEDSLPGELVRVEGDPATGDPEVDLAYDYLGDTYDFYFNEHARDSIDGAGLPLQAVVRYCEWSGECPMANAFWDDYEEVMLFGEGWAAADDVVAHELTHGVTFKTSNLIYWGEPGAINEAFSDIWGEFVDLTNGAGTDTDAVRWLMGEDTPIGAIRSMADPPAFGLPARYHDPYWYYGSWDYGGVHINMGVGSKLCYLLTDGDRFGRQNVTGMGISKVADLFYEVQTNLLTWGSDYADLAGALTQAAINLGFTSQERDNIGRACEAVGISPWLEEIELQNFRAVPFLGDNGSGALVPAVALSWENPTSDAFDHVVLTRRPGARPAGPTDGIVIYSGTGESADDGLGALNSMTPSTDYYYGLFAMDSAGEVFESNLIRVTSGNPPDDVGSPSDFLTEAFTNGTDLSYTQITFSPVGDITGVFDTRYPVSYVNHSNYVASFQQNVFELPVSRAGSIPLPLGEDSYQRLGTSDAPVPFFGGLYSEIMIAANGYLLPVDMSAASIQIFSDEFDFVNFPSLASHFETPRLSFLFADLSPSSGGDVWVKQERDPETGQALSEVVTFENVPEWGTSLPNTVQLEMFYNGQIRITYGALSVQDAVVGLSDGKGVPFDPNTGEPIETDLSAVEAPSGLIIDPVPLQFYTALLDENEDEYEFIVRAHSTAGTPALAASYLPDGSYFVDRGDGTGRFAWRPTPASVGAHSMVVYASLADKTASQDVMIFVEQADLTPLRPQALDLTLSSGDPLEDPGEDRLVGVDAQLTAGYTFYQPDEEADPVLYGEGAPQLIWFVDGNVCYALLNQTLVPSWATQVGQRWFFSVTPRTQTGMAGDPTTSPVVTIAPVFTSLSIESGPASGGVAAILTGMGLSNTRAVAFGDFVSTDIRILSDTQVEVVLPKATAAGTVNVTAIVELLSGEVFETPPPGDLIDFVYMPVIRSVIPNQGISAGGTTVLITGAGFTEDAQVTFGGVAAESVEVLSDTEIEAVTPPGTLGPKDVTVVAAGLSVTRRNGFTYIEAGALKADVNGDGATNALDVQYVVNAALGRNKAARNADLNADGRVDSLDIQIVINEALSF